jgi:predicted nucleic acid-binding protein
MIALDTNLLVYAYREDSEFHSIAMDANSSGHRRRQSVGVAVDVRA